MYGQLYSCFLFLTLQLPKVIAHQVKNQESFNYVILILPQRLIGYFTGYPSAMIKIMMCVCQQKTSRASYYRALILFLQHRNNTDVIAIALSGFKKSFDLLFITIS